MIGFLWSIASTTGKVLVCLILDTFGLPSCVACIDLLSFFEEQSLHKNDTDFSACGVVSQYSLFCSRLECKMIL